MFQSLKGKIQTAILESEVIVADVEFQSLKGKIQTQIAAENGWGIISFNPSKVRYKLKGNAHYVFTHEGFNPSKVRYKR